MTSYIVGENICKPPSNTEVVFKTIIKDSQNSIVKNKIIQLENEQNTS